MAVVDSILAALLHGTQAMGVSQTATFSRGCHIFKRVAITLRSAHILVLSFVSIVCRGVSILYGFMQYLITCALF